jgi:hypothetical protein
MEKTGEGRPTDVDQRPEISCAFPESGRRCFVPLRLRLERHHKISKSLDLGVRIFTPPGDIPPPDDICNSLNLHQKAPVRRLFSSMPL